ncbi:MAG: hypothetical protein UT55_C0036G0005 [Candidatus Peregrinibacteria bacterium GW2011_GWE2_39_6]|nr:MAG: hypothetical protein UT36_C0011G0033 [Candidatus Peregrinibacteria bacterium GW2011_GWF2_39_17]KKR25615.1 MAG: hypothetical protein UT55_C0036G0005 [Candidatus Peregrinibacteria bacterium GW2011_GWE2_39_6]HCW32510.1 hypothetical protein [Candidatus Peregrinibacteria bacterium]
MAQNFSGDKGPLKNFDNVSIGKVLSKNPGQMAELTLSQMKEAFRQTKEELINTLRAAKSNPSATNEMALAIDNLWEAYVAAMQTFEDDRGTINKDTLDALIDLVGVDITWYKDNNNAPGISAEQWTRPGNLENEIFQAKENQEKINAAIEQLAGESIGKMNRMKAINELFNFIKGHPALKGFSPLSGLGFLYGEKSAITDILKSYSRFLEDPYYLKASEVAQAAYRQAWSNQLSDNLYILDSSEDYLNAADEEDLDYMVKGKMENNIIGNGYKPPFAYKKDLDGEIKVIQPKTDPANNQSYYQLEPFTDFRTWNEKMAKIANPDFDLDTYFKSILPSALKTADDEIFYLDQTIPIFQDFGLEIENFTSNKNSFFESRQILSAVLNQGMIYHEDFGNIEETRLKINTLYDQNNEHLKTARSQCKEIAQSKFAELETDLAKYPSEETLKSLGIETAQLVQIKKEFDFSATKKQIEDFNPTLNWQLPPLRDISNNLKRAKENSEKIKGFYSLQGLSIANKSQEMAQGIEGFLSPLDEALDKKITTRGQNIAALKDQKGNLAKMKIDLDNFVPKFLIAFDPETFQNFLNIKTSLEGSDSPKKVLLQAYQEKGRDILNQHFATFKALEANPKYADFDKRRTAIFVNLNNRDITPKDLRVTFDNLFKLVDEVEKANNDRIKDEQTKRDRQKKEEIEKARAETKKQYSSRISKPSVAASSSIKKPAESSTTTETLRRSIDQNRVSALKISNAQIDRLDILIQASLTELLGGAYSRDKDLAWKALGVLKNASPQTLSQYLLITNEAGYILSKIPNKPTSGNVFEWMALITQKGSIQIKANLGLAAQNANNLNIGALKSEKEAFANHLNTPSQTNGIRVTPPRRTRE